MTCTAFTDQPLTLRNVSRDFAEWHLGRPEYALWAIDLDRAAVDQRVASAQQHLAGLLLPGYHRQPHVTLSLCGFPQIVPEAADDFSAAMLNRQVRALQCARPAPFELQIGRLASFSSAPYLAVNEAGEVLTSLRDVLGNALRDGVYGDLTDSASAPDGPYTPHVTVGLYADRWPTGAVQARLDSFDCGDTLRLTVDCLSLMSYRAAEIGGPLCRIASYDFSRQQLDWHRDSCLQTGS